MRGVGKENQGVFPLRAAPGGVLHRVRAQGDAVFVTTCTCGCMQADAADLAKIHDAQYHARSGVHHAWATQTVNGEPTPR